MDCRVPSAECRLLSPHKNLLFVSGFSEKRQSIKVFARLLDLLLLLVPADELQRLPFLFCTSRPGAPSSSKGLVAADIRHAKARLNQTCADVSPPLLGRRKFVLRDIFFNSAEHCSYAKRMTECKSLLSNNGPIPTRTSQ